MDSQRSSLLNVYESKTASPLLKGSDVARRLNISRSNAYNLMQSGKIPVVRIGRCLRVREEDLEAFIRQNTFPSGSRHEKTFF